MTSFFLSENTQMADTARVMEAGPKRWLLVDWWAVKAITGLANTELPS